MAGTAGTVVTGTRVPRSLRDQQRVATGQQRRVVQLLCTTAGSSVVVLLVLSTAWSSESRLGAPAYWPWLLTGAQVTALWGAGAHHWWGWPLGASVQPPWIAYAVMTDQLGFIAGCMLSGAVQAMSFLHEEDDVRHAVAIDGSRPGAARRIGPPTRQEDHDDRATD